MVSGDRLPDLLVTIFHSSVVPLKGSGLKDPSRVSNATC